MNAIAASVYSFTAVVALYGLSFVAHSQSAVGLGATGLILILFIFLLWRWPAIALAVLLAEFASTSFGRLFPVFNTPALSLRVCLLLLAFVYSVHAMFFKEVRSFLRPYAWPLTAIAAVVGWGIIRGLTAGRPFSAIVDDANGYASLMLLPFAVSVLRQAAARRVVLQAVLGAACALAGLTLLLYVWFLLPVSDVARDFVYRWVRDIRLGEITPRLGPPGVRRVFLQSQLWSAALLIWLAVQQFYKKHFFFWGILVASLLGSAVVIGGSRTIWLAVLVTVFLSVGRLLPLKDLARLRKTVLILVIAGFFGVAVPGMLGGSYFLGKTSARATQLLHEPAIDSRVRLLSPLVDAITSSPFLGQGFGTALTYTTYDPRLLAEQPDGQVTTTAFEWGWLDLWFKMGIGGPVFFAWLLGMILWRAWKKPTTPEELWSGSVVLFLAVAHVFSPWLNHPLGLGLLVLALVFTEVGRAEIPASLATRPR